MGLLGEGVLGSNGTGGGGGGGGAGLNGEELEFVTDTGAGSTALLGGQKLTDASAALDAGGINSISVLNGANAATMVASGLETIAIGHDVRALGDYAVSIGSGAEADNTGCTSVGYKAGAGTSVSLGIRATSIGYLCGATVGVEAVSVGRSANAKGDKSIALGWFTETTTISDGAVAIGGLADCNGEGSVSLGGGLATGAQAMSDGAIAIGGAIGATAAAIANTGDRAMAIGSGAVATAADCVSVGIGTNSTANTFQLNAMKLVVPATTTTRAGINSPHGTAPTTPVDGDIWTTTAGLYVRVNGSTVGPLS